MEKEKITIRDKRKNPQMVIDEDHPYFQAVKTGMMPDDYRKEMDETSNLDDEFREEAIGEYYKQIESPRCVYIKELDLKQILPMFPLIPVGIMID
ncbi:hypothetical protein ABB02_00376 [Clostridiaceae bacterium JG1575]|nr:hypothetical protein ABB02_00376 [Clostridiaceae bacterium JG1575]